MQRFVMFRVCAAAAALMAICAATAEAQYGRPGVRDPAAGERYHVEIAYGWWSPDPELVVSSESLGIPGSEIDAVADLGFEKETFRDFRVVLRPARKHKFRIEYLPIKYEAEAILTRDIVFNGILYRVGVPVNSTFEWKSWRFGYEYDFVSLDRFFAGFIVDARYTDVNVSLESPIDSEFASAKAPIPTLGGIVRAYPARYVSVTTEITGFKLPATDDYEGKYLDVNIYGTVNFGNNVGAQVGWRKLAVDYLAEDDFGDLDHTGFYFQGVVRF